MVPFGVPLKFTVAELPEHIGELPEIAAESIPPTEIVTLSVSVCEQLPKDTETKV